MKQLLKSVRGKYPVWGTIPWAGGSIRLCKSATTVGGIESSLEWVCGVCKGGGLPRGDLGPDTGRRGLPMRQGLRSLEKFVAGRGEGLMVEVGSGCAED